MATTEARALRGGLILAGNIGHNKLIVEADYLQVIEMVRNGGYLIGPVAVWRPSLMIVTFLSRNFDYIFFSLPSQYDAHVLTNHGEGSLSIVWNMEPSTFWWM